MAHSFRRRGSYPPGLTRHQTSFSFCHFSSRLTNLAPPVWVPKSTFQKGQTALAGLQFWHCSLSIPRSLALVGPDHLGGSEGG